MRISLLMLGLVLTIQPATSSDLGDPPWWTVRLMPTRVSETASEGDTYFQQGMTYLKDKKYESAIHAFDEASAKGVKTPDLFLYRGTCYYELKRDEQALRDLSRAIKLRPTDAHAYWLRADIHERGGQARESIEDLNRGLEISPNPIAWQLYQARGAAYLNLNEPGKAIQDLTRAIELGGSAIGRYSVRIYWLRGRAFMRLARYEEAIQDFSAVLERNSDHYDSLLDRGWVYDCLGDFKKSIQDFSRVVSRNPDDLYARSLRGGGYLGMGDIDAALADLDHAAQHGSRDPWLYIHLANAFYENGKLEKALEANERALAYGDRKTEAPIYFQKGLFLLAAGRGGEAQTAYDQGRIAAEKLPSRIYLEDAIDELREAMETDARMKPVATAIIRTLEQSHSKISSETLQDTLLCQVPRPHRITQSQRTTGR